MEAYLPISSSCSPSSSSSSSPPSSLSSIDEIDVNYTQTFLSRSPAFFPLLGAIYADEATSQPRPRKKRTEKPRQIREGALRLQRDYFDAKPVYPERDCRRRFRMSRSLFIKIADELIAKNSFFPQKRDAANRLGLSPYQKITAGLRLLAYDIGADAVDEYLRLGSSTAMNCLKKFSHAIVSIFGTQYLREPNEQDVLKLNNVNTCRGFPGMLGSVDCMHLKWKNCPAAWAAQFQSGHRKEPSIVLQAVASQDLWIWHAYFGMPGCNNDINVLEGSNLFDNFSKGEAPNCRFQLNGNEYNMG